VSHWYLAGKQQLQDALTEYVAGMAPDQAHATKQAVQDFMDSEVSRRHRIRMESIEPVVAPAKVAA
jgi:hypothetical protein